MYKCIEQRVQNIITTLNSVCGKIIITYYHYHYHYHFKTGKVGNSNWQVHEHSDQSSAALTTALAKTTHDS